MKSLVVYFLSFSLLIAILAPSIGTLMELFDGEQIVMDFNEEEENYETTIEFAEKHFVNNNLQNDMSFLAFGKLHSFSKDDTCLILSNFKEVFLPPPKV
ncbi:MULTISPECIES: hypothetical protein [Maribacter]|uniref:Uncharacterized protein n=2 Tax=Maribacter TaxID=252356 RepID=A0A5B2TZE2_9FLAO|nr:MULTISPECIES: hypothetical protein [Maribacter]KAA2219428.1 hypothetical protein F0361_07450 [Maribacter flavus]MDC6404365.1 hypothetical protein [Maribacter sp. PR66]MEE1971507.1 hypothetical protein [Maribacter flavus]TLF46650.1 hypothetical protein FEK29_02420 [Maribacter aurantiacus]